MNRPSTAPVARFLALALCLTPAAYAETIVGRVVAVSDGDTLIVLDASNTQHKIRLSGIDAPERRQSFGEVSKQNLARLVFGKTVVVDWANRDRYRRIVGKVIVSRTDANLAQVKAGLAWHYRQYLKTQPAADRLSYAAAERRARTKRLGLWADAAPVPPWEFRRK